MAVSRVKTIQGIMLTRRSTSRLFVYGPATIIATELKIFAVAALNISSAEHYFLEKNYAMRNSMIDTL